MTTKSHLFFSSSDVYPRLYALLLSVDFLFLRSLLLPSRCRLVTMLPASFASKPDSSPVLGLEGLHHNIATIGLTLPPPSEGYFLSCTSILAQGMWEDLPSKFSGQASGKWSVRLLCLLIFANDRGLWWFGGGRHFHGTSRLPWS